MVLQQVISKKMHGSTFSQLLIVLYCQGGFRSALAGESIKKMGYTNVFSMSGGFSDWANNNFSIDKPQ